MLFCRRVASDKGGRVDSDNCQRDDSDDEHRVTSDCFAVVLLLIVCHRVNSYNERHVTSDSFAVVLLRIRDAALKLIIANVMIRMTNIMLLQIVFPSCCF